MRILGVIPARMAASRFPNKPMALIQGMPMIGHCYFRSILCELLDEVYVATCDESIADYIIGLGGKAVMTSDKHERASERSAEALVNIETELKGVNFDIIVMIQGDEPLIDPEMIREVLNPLQLDSSKRVSNLMSILHTQAECDNPNNVKVVTDLTGKALYMSREAIPSRQKFKDKFDTFRQLGLIAFTRDALLEFVALSTTTLEIVESVDMNRFLEHGKSIHMVLTKHEADAVDNPEDLILVEEKMGKDQLFKTYQNNKK